MPKLTYLIDDVTIAEEEIEVGATISPISAPEKEGYDFALWSGLPEVMPEEDVTVTGVYAPDSFTLTIMLDDEVWETRQLQSGTSLADIPDPQKVGHTFEGWVKRYKKMPKSNLTMRGTFKVNTYHLTFEIDGITFERDVDYGTSLGLIANPERDNYTFSGWGDIPETMPDHDLRFAGSFRVDTYKLTFKLNGEVYETRYLTVGEPIQGAVVAQKEGYVFSGWRKLPATMPAHDVTIEGKYHVKKSKITFMVDGKKYAWVSQAVGDVVTPPEAPEKEGYDFSGWQGLPDTMPQKDLVVEALFTPKA